MPAYDYRCVPCATTFEVVRPLGETGKVTCPSCGAPAKRVFTPVGVHFKGSGFHNTDYRSTNRAESSAANASGSTSCPAASESGCSGCAAAD